MCSFINKVKGKLKHFRNNIVYKKRIKQLDSPKTVFQINGNKRKQKVIVSLTSFPLRFDTLHYTIKSLLVQTMSPDEIILYLSEEDASEINCLPDSLLTLRKYGFRIEIRPYNIRPHKKYYYAMLENPDDIIITVDDDMIYDPRMIEELYTTHTRFPDCVVAARGHQMLFTKSGTIEEYNRWNWAVDKPYSPSIRLWSTGVGGVLYPPGCMHKDLLNIELLKALSLNADDIWLKFMQVLVGTKVVLCGSFLKNNMFVVKGSQEVSLNANNVFDNKNDIYIQNLLEHYQLSSKAFEEHS